MKGAILGSIEAIQLAEQAESEQRRKRERRNEDLNAAYRRHLGRVPAEAGRQEEMLKDARRYAADCLKGAAMVVPLAQQPLEEDVLSTPDAVGDLLASNIWRDFLPRQRNYSDFRLEYREFKTALLTEGFPSLQESASDAIRRGLTLQSLALTLISARLDSQGVNNAGLHSQPTNRSEQSNPVRRLDTERIRHWMQSECHTNPTLAEALQVTVKTVSSLRNNGNYHGMDAVTKLANLMGCEFPSDLMLD